MGKRKNNNSNDLLTPKQENEKKKKTNVDSDDSLQDLEQDEEGHYEEEHPEVEETQLEDGQTNYEPDQFRKLVESFNRFVINRDSSMTTVHNMERIVTEWANEQQELIDTGLFLADYRRYLKTALRYRVMHLSDASSSLISYLESEKSLSDFKKSMPEKPPTKVQLYAKKHKIPYKFQSLKEIHARIQADVDGSREVDEELRELNKKYIPRLQEFVDSHPDLSAEQGKHLKNKINSLSKKYIPKVVVPKTPKTSKGKQDKKEPETAYSLFCRSKANEYRDLSEVDRERKLRKKFKKLQPDAVAIYESLALNM